MIINIAGTSGSGKSHLMRSVLKWARENGDVDEDTGLENAKCLGYYLHPVVFNERDEAAYIVGAYDAPTGGCDTIHDVKQIFDTVLELHNHGLHVLYEGLFVMNMTRGPALAAEVGADLCVLQLATPLAECFKSINARRAERGEGALETKKNTEDNYRRAQNYCAKMRDAGARVFRVTRDEGFSKIMELLGVDQH